MLICTPTVECQDFKQEELLLPMNILQLGNEFLMRKMEIKSNEKKILYSNSQATFWSDLHAAEFKSTLGMKFFFEKLVKIPTSVAHYFLQNEYR